MPISQRKKVSKQHKLTKSISRAKLSKSRSKICFTVVALVLLVIVVVFITTPLESTSGKSLKIKPIRGGIPDYKQGSLFKQVSFLHLAGSVRGKTCANFDHGDISPAEDVTSVFNCNSEAGKCRWFYPAKFFDRECGVGKEYYHLVEEIEKKRVSQKLWKGMPLIILPSASLNSKMDDKNKVRNGVPFPQHNISMTHIHKTGGTSLVQAFSAVKQKGGSAKRDTVYMYGHWDEKEEKFRRESAKLLSGAVKYKSEWNKNEHTLIGVVRDPAERFISAIGQAMGGIGSRSNGVQVWLKKKCIKKTSKETLRCCINLIKNKGTYVEIHFTPMALEVAFATMYKDIPVAIFPFKEVPTLMYELGAEPHSMKKNGMKMRTDQVLHDMSIDDYDHDMLKDLCDIFRLDVVFLHHIGFQTRCDSIL